MNRVRIGLLAGIALLVVCTTVSQETGWLDLTDLHPRERIRAPHAGSLECGGGAGFETSLEANITLMYLDKTCPRGFDRFLTCIFYLYLVGDFLTDRIRSFV